MQNYATGAIHFSLKFTGHWRPL